MINEDDLARLVGLESEQKFCKVERIARSRLEDAQREAIRGEPPVYSDYDYMVAVLAAAEEFGIDELADYHLPWVSDSECHEKCEMFRRQATRVSHRLLLRYGTRSKTVALDAATKGKMSHWLKQMRQAVQEAEVSSEKKDRLFALINELQAEVDRDRTPVDAACELWMTICTYMGEGAKKLEPVARLAERIGGAFGLAKKAEDTPPKLPPRREQKRIEPPKQKNNAFDRELDEEIPF